MAATDGRDGQRGAAGAAGHGRGLVDPSHVGPLRTLALVLLAALVVLGLWWELAGAPTGRGWLALKVLPLALAMPGLARHRLYTARWLSLAIWLYVLEGLVRATSDPMPSALYAWAETLLAVALFVVIVLYVKCRFAGAPVPAAAAPLPARTAR